MKQRLKKLLAVVLSMAVMFTAIPGIEAFASDASVTPAIAVRSTEVNAGNGFTVYVSAENVENLAGLEIGVHYDDSVMSVSNSWTTGIISDEYCDVNCTEAGVVKMSMVSLNGISGSGNILGITFITDGDAEIGEYPLNLTVSSAYDVSFNDITFVKRNGIVKINEAPETIESAGFYAGVSKSEVQAGEEFTYTLQSQSIGDLAGGDFIFTYDPELLEVADVDLSDTLLRDDAIYAINKKTPGVVKISYASMTAINAGWYKDFFTITFKAKDKGCDATDILFSTSGLVGEDLGAMTASGITRVIKIIVPEPEIDYPDFLVTWDGQLADGRTVNVKVALPADSKIEAGDFTITYNANQMTCISAEADSSVKKAGGYLVTKEDIGNGTVKFSYINSNTVADELPLLNLTFQVKDQFLGDTVLNANGKGVKDSNFEDVILDYPQEVITIEPIDISGMQITGVDGSYVYTGSEIRPAASIEGLTEGKDYIVEYSNNLNVGPASVKITGTGNYGGELSAPFMITPAQMTGITAESYSGTYDGKPHTIKVNGVPDGAAVTYTAEKDGDYAAELPTLTDADSTTIYYKVSKDNYFTVYGEATITISCASIEEKDVTGLDTSYVYTGSEITPAVTVAGLTAGKDYIVTYSNNLDVGPASVKITGTGNYTGESIKPFEITNAEMSGVKAAGYDGTYDGKAHTISVEAPDGATVKYAVSADGPFTADAPSLTNAGDLTVYYKVEKANYNDVTGSAKIVIAKASIEKLKAEGIPKEVVYTGAAFTPEVTIEGLTAGTDFDVTYTDNVNAGTARVMITGKGNYEGTTEETFEILPKDMEGIEVSGYEGIYDGKPHTISVTAPEGAAVTYAADKNGEYTAEAPTLTEADDLVVYYRIEKANYNTVEGSAIIKITPASIVKMEVSGLEASYTYEAKDITPAVSIEGLTEGTDFVVSYEENLNVGTATVTIEGKGNYKGTIVKTFQITPADMTGIEVSGYEGIYDGQAHAVSVTVPDGAAVEYKTAADGEYGAELPEFTKAGVWTVYYKITKENYNDVTGTATVKIDPKSIAGMELENLDESYFFIGVEIQPDISIPGLVKGTDYDVAYSNNINAGIAKITVTGKGNYTGTITEDFTIKPIDLAGVTVTGYTGVYDKAAHTVTVEGLPEDASIGYAASAEGPFTAEAPAITNVGKTTVYFKVTRANYNDFTGSVDLEITPASIADMKISGAPESVVYTGSALTPAVTIEGLTAGKDYDIAYTDNVNVGTATITATAKGNYAGTITETFKITPASIKDLKISGVPESVVYTGSEIEPAVTVDGLVEGDYEVSYKDNINVGTATVTVTGKGNYAGTITETFKITPASIADMTVEGLTAEYVYTGKAIEPEVTVAELKDGDYEVSYVANVNVGTATVTITGKDNFTGMITRTFAITPASIKNMVISGAPESVVYTGSAQTPAITIEGLTAGTDYDIAYTGNVNVGTATITATAKGNYAGTITETFKITPASIKDMKISGVPESVVYTGSEIEPAVTVDGLAEGDYEVSYEDNINVGTATVTVTGKGNYKDQITDEFEITPADMTGVEATDYEGIYDGKAHSITVTAPEGAEVTYALDENGKFGADAPTRTSAGTLTVYYKVAKENYKDVMGSAIVKISPASITDMTVEGLKASYVYTGEAIEPEVTVAELGEGDYTVSYENNINAGTAIVTVKGKGNYTGEISKTFNILPADLEGLTISGYEGIYDGKPHTVTAIGLPEDAVIMYSAASNGDYAEEAPSITDVGELTVYYKVERTNYNPLNGFAKIKITPADLKGVEAAGYEGIYDGKAHTITVTAPEGAVVTYSADKNGEYTAAAPTLTNAGSLTVYYKVEKANYNAASGSAKVVITPASIKDMEISGAPESVVYTGSAQTPAVTIEGLTAGTDYDIAYTDNVNVGTATITATAKGNYAGTITDTFKITPASIVGKVIKDLAESYVYTGSAIEPAVTVDGLAEGDYEVSYSENKNVGTATVTVTGKGNYAGTITDTFKITPVSIKDMKISGLKESYTYTGSAIKPAVTVEGLAADDYDVSYSANVNVGTATVTVTAKGNYAGIITDTFKITSASIAGMKINGVPESVEYTGSAITPAVTVEGLSADDYDVSYSDNVNVGTATVTVTGKGNYAGIITETFKITPIDMKDVTATGYEGNYDGKEHTITVLAPEGATVTYALEANGKYSAEVPTLTNAGELTVYYKVEKANYNVMSGSAKIKITAAPITGKTVDGLAEGYIYTGRAIEPEVTVAGLKTGDFTVEYENNVNVGTATVKVTGKGNYTGTITGTFKITPASITGKTISGVNASYIYTGSAIEPEITVEGLTADDYDVSYSGNVNVGKATVTVTGKGNYSGTITDTFEITPADMSGIKASGYTGSYDGKAHGITVTAPEDASVTFSADKNGKFTAEAPTLTNAGELTVYYKVEKTNYKDVTGSAVIKINPATIKGKEISGLEKSYVYTGSVITPEVTVDGLAPADYTVSYVNNVNAGTATVTVTAKGNYSGSISADFNIAPAEMTVTAAGYEGVYDGIAHGISVTAPEGTKVTYSADKNGEFTADAPTLTNAGSLTVYYKAEKANYKTVSGSAVIKITPADMTGKTVSGLAASYAYTGSAIKPAVTVDGLNTGDFDVAYTNNTNVGTATVTVTGKGNYSGTITGTFKITAASIAGKTISGVETSYVYTGSAITPVVTVEGLKASDYEVGYSNNVNAGTATITVTAKGNYSGVITKTFVIDPAEMTVTAAGYEGVFDGAAHGITVTAPEGAKVTYATDPNGKYVASAPTLTNAGELTVYYKAEKANYKTVSGSAKVVITPVSLTGKTISGLAANYAYTGSAITPVVSVEGLTAADYTVSYVNNLNVGTATVTVTGKGNYSGTITETFEIKPAQFKGVYATGFDGYYDGKAHSIIVKGLPQGAYVTYSLKVDGEFTKECPSVTNAGNWTIFYKVDMSGYETWLGSGDVIIRQASIANMQVSGIEASYEYTGSAIAPVVSVSDLKSGTDYEVRYSNNTNVGTATVMITGKGNYTGKIVKTFEITEPAKPPVKGEIIRLAGNDRFATSAEIAKGFVPGNNANAILIANGMNFADALAATPFAVEIGAPILMINGPQGSFTSEVKSEIDRIDSDHNATVYLIGGPGAVSPKAETVLKEYGYTDIRRVAGNNRFATAIEVAKMRNGEKTAYIANGMNFPDALGGGSAAALNDGVILFTLTERMDAETKAFIQRQGYDNIVILGGPGAVSQAVENELKTICGNVERVYGSNRFATAAAVAQKYFTGADTVIVANGMDFPDALAGGPLAADFDAPVLLINGKGTEIPPEIQSYIKNNGVKKILVLGGPGAVSEKLYNDLAALVK